MNEKVFCNVSLSNSENVLKRNLTTGIARRCIFREFGSTDFENLCTGCQPWWHLCGFDGCTGLPKKTLDVTDFNKY